MTTSGEGHFASPLSGRSFINPITNASVISSFEIGTHLPRLAQRTLPSDCLPAFLHEATHHWCFMHTLGATLAYLHERALRDAAAYELNGQVSNEAAQRLLASMMRFEALMTLQRPLAEGLALFAEFDLASHGTLPVLCPVLQRVADYFGPHGVNIHVVG